MQKFFVLVKAEQLVTAWRSDNGKVSQQTQVVIGDSMGEMLDYYSVANIAFVGGSLVNTGCQNVLEPAALGIPVVVGPSQFNFATICKQLEHSGALTTVQNEWRVGAETVRPVYRRESATGNGEARQTTDTRESECLAGLARSD